jgi:hypothetical protein
MTLKGPQRMRADNLNGVGAPYELRERLDEMLVAIRRAYVAITLWLRLEAIFCG